jgi:hypothetical protein
MTLNLPPYPSQSGLTPSSSFAQFTVQNRVPATTDVNWPVGTIWIYPAGTTSYILAALASSAGIVTATWLVNTGGSGAISTITGTTGGPESPLAGNFNLLGTANQIVVTGSANTETLSLVGPYTPATYTAHGVLIGEGTSSIVATTAGTTGQVLIGSTGADPAFGALGLNSGLTVHGVLLGENNSAIVATTAGSTGQVLKGSTSADPAFGNISEFNIVDVTGTTQTLAAATSYIADNAALVTFTLPASGTKGDVMKIRGNGAGGWRIAQNANQQIVLSAQSTTVGAGGSVSSGNHYDSIELFCVVSGASTVWNAASYTGTLTFV